MNRSFFTRIIAVAAAAIALFAITGTTNTLHAQCTDTNEVFVGIAPGVAPGCLPVSVTITWAGGGTQTQNVSAAAVKKFVNPNPTHDGHDNPATISLCGSAPRPFTAINCFQCGNCCLTTTPGTMGICFTVAIGQVACPCP